MIANEQQPNIPVAGRDTMPAPVNAEPDLPYRPQLRSNDDDALRYGKLLWSLIISQVAAGLVMAIGYASRLAALDLFRHGLAEFEGLVVAPFASGACLVISGLALIISSRRGGLNCAIVMMGAIVLTNTAFGMIPLLVGMAPEVPGLPLPARVVTTIMGQGTVAALGSLAYFLTTPRLLQLFPRQGRQPQTVVDHRIWTARPASSVMLRRQLGSTWIIVLIALLLVPVGWSLRSLYELLSTWPHGSDRQDPQSVLLNHMVEYGFAAVCLMLVALLLIRRRWSSIIITVIALWLVSPASFVWFFWLQRQTGLHISGDLSIYPSGFGFEWVGAMGWTAYLMQSPQVHRLYPGHRRRHELVTDVDVF